MSRPQKFSNALGKHINTHVTRAALSKQSADKEMNRVEVRELDPFDLLVALTDQLRQTSKRDERDQP